MSYIMNDTAKKVLLAVGAVLILVLALFGLPGKEDGMLGAGDSFQSSSFNLIGSSTASSTLTNLYGGTSSTSVNVRGYPNISITGSYTPKSHGSAIYLLVERSLDNGTNFQPYSVLVPGTTQVPVYAAGASSTSGIPFLVPGAGTGGSTSGTAIDFSFDISLAADRMRVQVKESSTSTYGLLRLQGVASSN